MKKARSKDPDMLDEYDFSGGERGKYAARYQEGSNIVVLDPDVAAIFPDSEAVNKALRAVGQIVQERSKDLPPGTTPKRKRAS